MKKPKYGWSDLVGQVLAVICLTIGTADALVGLTLWSTAFTGVALGIIACCKVDRLRQDIRITTGHGVAHYHVQRDDDAAAQFKRMEQTEHA